MSHLVSRRHFLGGAAALVGATAIGTQSHWLYRVANAEQVQHATSTIYPPALIGLRGDNDGSQAAAHGVAMGGKSYTLPETVSERYDLVVVGAGLSGLAAAFFYHQKHPQAKILLVDNHEDFGGHAIRNEFTVDGRKLISYGGSESIDGPKEGFSAQAKQLLRDLGVDYNKFERYFQGDLYEKKWGLDMGLLFNAKTFGKNHLVVGEPEIGQAKSAAIIAQFPLSDADKHQLTQIYLKPADYLKGKSRREREQYAAQTSYHDFLKERVHLSESCLKFLQNLSSDYWGHDIHAMSVNAALENGYPGVQNLHLAAKRTEEEPYIYHFPDGNASLARLIVCKLIPNVAPVHSDTMEAIVTAPFDYAQLDKESNLVRLRLNTTALLIENQADGSVAVACLTRGNDKLMRIQVAKCIYAGHAVLASRVIPQMPEEQKQAMLTNVRVPVVYAKVALKNAHAFQKLGVYHLYMPDMPYCEMMLDYAVNMGGYTAPQTPDEPIVLHMIAMYADVQAKTARDKYRVGRRRLAGKNYDVLQQELMEQLQTFYDLAGEKVADVVSAIRINRWAHGYSYERVALFDSKESKDTATHKMQQRIGNIFMANSDVDWAPYVQGAFDQAYRAVQEAA